MIVLYLIIRNYEYLFIKQSNSPEKLATMFISGPDRPFRQSRSLHIRS
jgi:hypothetical protein